MRMNKNAIILKQNNQLPVKYANMLKRPAVFRKSPDENADRTGKYEGRTRTDKPGSITLV